MVRWHADCVPFTVMMEIFTASSLEEAKQQAAAAFSAPIESIRFTVLEEPKRGLLGLLGKKSGEYKVKAEYEPVSAAEESVSADVEAATEDVTADVPAIEEAVVVPAETAPVSDADMQEKLDRAVDYLKSIVAHFDSDAVVAGSITENGVLIELQGSNSGALIGRRGETLDAMQYLASMVANRGDREYLRVSVDTCGYREKRQKALQDLAARLSKTVLRNGRGVTLEPMNPYERRIIHSTVTEIEGVSSHSTGEEPNRRVIIMPDHPAPGNDRPVDLRHRDARRRGGNDHRHRSGNGNGGRNRRNDRRSTGEGLHRLDLSTSFEKDYKRPKPEDALNTGVYGKIDLD